MTEQPMPMEIPEINPQVTAQQIAGVISKLDKMPSTVTVTDLLNFLQDDLMPAIAKVHEEVSANYVYLGLHEGRITDIESGSAVGIPPEEAEILLQFAHESVSFFKSLLATKEMKGNQQLIALVADGEKCIDIIEDLKIEDEDDGAESAH